MSKSRRQLLSFVFGVLASVSLNAIADDVPPAKKTCVDFLAMCNSRCDKGGPLIKPDCKPECLKKFGPQTCKD